MQDFLVDSTFAVGAIVANNALDKLLDDDQPILKDGGSGCPMVWLVLKVRNMPHSFMVLFLMK